MTEINKDEIRKAIDKLQLKHPCPFSYDATRFESMENISELDRAIDMLSKRMNEDAEINIICEFAKLYLEGVKPTVEPKQGEWIFKNGKYRCTSCGDKAIYRYNGTSTIPKEILTDFCPNCGARMKEGDEK